MKKIVMAAIAVLGLSTAAQAQMDVKFGPKVGLNLASISDLNDSSMRTAYYVGAVAEFKINSRFSIQPEIVYSAQGAEGKNFGIKTKFKNDYVTVPVMAKIYLIDGLNFEIGPQIGFLVNAKGSVDVNGVEVGKDLKSDLKSTDVSLGLGAAYELPMGFFVNARYNLGLTKVVEDDNSDSKNNVIQLGAGYKF